jgi:hypothetical protein
MSIADVLLLVAELTEPIMNEFATGYGSESDGGGGMLIRSHGGIEQGSVEHIRAAAGIQAQNHQPTGNYDHPPEIHKAQTALDGIKKISCPPQDKGPSYKDPGLDKLLQGCLEPQLESM